MRLNLGNPLDLNHELNRGIGGFWLGLPNIAGGARSINLVNPGISSADLTNAASWGGSSSELSTIGRGIVSGSASLASYPAGFLTTTGERTIEWAGFYATSMGSFSSVMSMGATVWRVSRRGSTNDIEVVYYNNVSTTFQTIYVGPVYNGAWNHVIATFTSDLRIDIYLNGAHFSGIDNSATTINNNSSSPTLTVGSSGYTSEFIAIYNRGVSHEEAHQMYADYKAGFAERLTRYAVRPYSRTAAIPPAITRRPFFSDWGSLC